MLPALQVKKLRFQKDLSKMTELIFDPGFAHSKGSILCVCIKI